MGRKDAIRAIVRRIIKGERNLEDIKREECKRYRVPGMVKNPEIIAEFPSGGLSDELRRLLLKKPTRTISGVTPIAVMVKPQGSCRHACAYCFFSGLAAKSYTGFEPAALRARQYEFDPYLQASSRAEQFEGGGHPADKCEVIIMGGTFLDMERRYKRSFIKGVYEGLNGARSKSLEDSMKANEANRTHRVVGLTIETRPDVCKGHIGEMLSYGATRVELGVQHPNDRIYSLISRGHSVRDVADSTSALKDASFKVLYHIMPGLPGSSPKKDVSMIVRLFRDTRFRPDMLKIYPTLVIEGSALHAMAKRGEYAPYSAEEAADVISEFYRHIPKYVRVMRIQRDIPTPRISMGVMKSNLRELVEEKIREKGISPREMRFREIGLQKKRAALSGFSIRRLDYAASGGKETFLSYENDEGLIAGFIRMRFPGQCLRQEITCASALIRELHVYGAEALIDGGGEVQHQGLGAGLLQEAEEIAREKGKDSMLIISGVGVREYYRKRGYIQKGPYMAKSL